MECRLICTPRSSKTATLAARPIRRAAARTSSSATPAMRAVARDVDVGQGVDDLVGAGGVLGDPRRGRPGPRRRRRRPGRRCSQASVPGRTCRWMSASSAVSVRRGSTTIMARAGSRAISFSVVRARGKLWLCQGFLPMKTTTSPCSISPRTLVPNIWALTQNSPVFSWARAFDRCLPAPNAAREALGVGAAEVVPLPAAAEVEDRRRRRACRAPRRAGPRPRRSRCPSRPPRRCRRAGGAAAGSAAAEAGHAGRGDGGRRGSGSGRGAAPSRTCSPATSGAPCRPGCG